MSRRTSNANHEKWPEVTQGLCFIREVIGLLLKYKERFFLEMSLCTGLPCVRMWKLNHLALTLSTESFCSSCNKWLRQ